MLEKDYQRICDILHESGISWTKGQINSLGVKQLLHILIDESPQAEENGMTVEAGGVMIKKYPDKSFVYAYIGEY